MNKLRSFVARLDYKPVLIVLLIAWLVRFLYEWLVPSIWSTDLVSWWNVAVTLAAGKNPYHETTALNWPPFWIQIIYALSQIYSHVRSYISFIHLFLLLLVGVESLVIVALFRFLRQAAPQSRPFVPILLGVALNPVAIFLTCQHGNFDVFVGLWVLLFVGQLVRYYQSRDDADWLAACLFLGLGILTKTVPLVLCPMLAGGWRRVSGKTRLLGTALVFGPVTLGMSVIYVLTPADVTSNVLAYRSSSGWFGISGLLHRADADNLIGVANLLFYLVLLGAAGWVARVFWRREQVGAGEIVLCATLFLAALPALGPGYGPQYFYWFLPLLVASYVLFPGWRIVLIAFGVVAVLTDIVEYGFFPSHGMFLVHVVFPHTVDEHGQFSVPPNYDRMDQLMKWINFGVSLGLQRTQTLVRLPMFAAFLMLLITGGRLLVRGFRAKEDSKGG